MDEQKIIREILERGELQVTTQERQNQHQNAFRDVINIIVEKTVNPDTNRPYPASVIEKSIADLHYNMNASKSTKQHALEIIKLLQAEKIIPITRASMRIQISVPSKEAKRLREKITANVVRIESEDFGATDALFICTIDPGQFRVLTDLMQLETRGRGRIDFLSLSQTSAGDEKFV